MTWRWDEDNMTTAFNFKVKKSEWIGRRLAEMQFGRTLQGMFQAILFFPLYFKMYHLPTWAWAVLIIAFGFLTWLTGWAAYHFKIVENFRKKEFKGIL